MSHAVRLIILAENTAEGRGLRGEHGLSFWVERDEKRLLFDTGQGLVLRDNGTALRLDFAQLDAIVLSHGHYDHSGGLDQVLAATTHALSVFAHPAALLPKYRQAGDDVREVGMPVFCREALSGANVTVILSREPADVAPGIRTTGEIPRRHPQERSEERFCLDAAGQIEDPIQDDMALIVETAEGVVLLLGCAHAGLINTLDHVRDVTANAPIRAVVGGMHLRNASPERMAWTLRELARFDIGQIIPLHCTGIPATAALWQAFPGRCRGAGAGTTLIY